MAARRAAGVRAATCAAVAAATLFAQRASGELGVVAIGDWGGKSNDEPTTLSQRLTAIGLSRKVAEFDASFAMLMGDNFYQHGVAGDETSSRFRDTFEEVYAKLALGLPFYAFAGNHDYGEGMMANVSSQVAYAKRSTQWVFPHLWYKIHRDFEADGQTRSLDMLIIDTVVLCGNGPENEGFIDDELRFLGDAYLHADGRQGLSRREAAAEAQWAWLDAQMAASRADFLWVSGHYPIWSVGADGSSTCLIDRLRPLLLRHGAHYISGHDHMLEHFVHEGLNSFVVGAGKECCYDIDNMDGRIPPGSMRYLLAGENGSASQPPVPFPVYGGFASLVFGAETVEVALHAHNGTVLYDAPAISRRKLAPPSSPLLLVGFGAAAAAVLAAVVMSCVRATRARGLRRELLKGSSP